MGHVSPAVQVGAVAGDAGRGAAGHERLALPQASLRHIGDERRARIAILGALQILRHFDDAVPIGSMPPSGDFANMPPVTKVLGTVSVSTIFTKDPSFSEEKYFAAAAISSSVSFAAI